MNTRVAAVAVEVAVSRAEMIQAIRDFVENERKEKAASRVPEHEQLQLFPVGKAPGLLRVLTRNNPADWGQFLADTETVRMLYNYIRTEIELRAEAQQQAKFAAFLIPAIQNSDGFELWS